MLGEYSIDGSAAASNLQVLSDSSQENIIDYYDDCVMEAAEAALPAQQKVFEAINSPKILRTIGTNVDC